MELYLMLDKHAYDNKCTYTCRVCFQSLSPWFVYAYNLCLSWLTKAYCVYTYMGGQLQLPVQWTAYTCYSSCHRSHVEPPRGGVCMWIFLLVAAP